MWWAVGRAVLWAFAGIQSYQFAKPVLNFFGLSHDEDDPSPPSGSSVVLWLVVILLLFGFAYFLLRAGATFGRRERNGR
jgi:hypothetical protein